MGEPSEEESTTEGIADLILVAALSLALVADWPTFFGMIDAWLP